MTNTLPISIFAENYILEYQIAQRLAKIRMERFCAASEDGEGAHSIGLFCERERERG